MSKARDLASGSFAEVDITGELNLSGSAGTSGQLLTSAGASTAPTWQDAASAGWEYVSTSTASNSASITFSGLDFDTYEYAIQIENLISVTNSVYFELKTSTGGSYLYTYSLSRNMTLATQNYNGQLTYAYIFNVAGGVGSMILYFEAPNGAELLGRMQYFTGNATYGYKFGDALIRADETHTNVTSLRFSLSSGNISTGTFILNRQPRKPLS